jgi:predicted RecB family endonuclease
MLIGSSPGDGGVSTSDTEAAVVVVEAVETDVVAGAGGGTTDVAVVGGSVAVQAVRRMSPVASNTRMAW